jgi:hypothetical protein
MAKSFPSLIEKKLRGYSVDALAEQRRLMSVTLTDPSGFPLCPAHAVRAAFPFVFRWTPR